MKAVWVKKATVEDLAQACKWFMDTAGNCYEPQVLAYPKTELLKAFNADKNIMYVPIQTVFMPDALGFNPDASVAEKASALQSLFQVLTFEARTLGHGELFFLCREPSTVAFAERHGFEKVTLPVFRIKL